jgi:hypothetical protein
MFQRACAIREQWERENGVTTTRVAGDYVGANTPQLLAPLDVAPTFKCPYCETRFRQKAAIYRHMHVKHDKYSLIVDKEA